MLRDDQVFRVSPLGLIASAMTIKWSCWNRSFDVWLCKAEDGYA
jgi:hypothetical protein